MCFRRSSRSIIELNGDAQTKAARESDFDRFCIDFGANLASQSVDIKSKYQGFLKASWNAIFAAKMRQRGARYGSRGSPNGMCRILGDDYGGV